MSNILIRVFDVAYVHDTARYLPFYENLSLKEPNASVSNFQILRSGSSLGKSTNFSHLFNNCFLEMGSLSSKSYLADYLVSLLSILS